VDIGKLITQDTAECVIYDPTTGHPTDIKITVYGADSAKFREVALAKAKQRVKAKAEGKEIAESIERDAEELADLTAGWENVQMGAKALPFNRDNCIKVFTMSAPIRKQVDSFIMRTANFLPKA
jgi:hypothetical protein